MMNIQYITTTFKHILPEHIPKVSNDRCSLMEPLDLNTTDYQDGTAMYLGIPLIHIVSSYFHDLLDDDHVYASYPTSH